MNCGAMITRARAKALAAKNKRKCFVVTEELKDPGIPNLVLRRRRSSGVAEDMASKNQLKMVKRLAKKNAVAAKRKKETGDYSEKDLQVIEDPKGKRQKVDPTPAQGIRQKVDPKPAQGIPENKALVKEPASLKSKDSSSSDWKQRKRHEDDWDKSAEEMIEFLNAASDWGVTFAMLAQYFVGATRDPTAFPKMTKELHRVTTKLEIDELKMQKAIGQVKLLTEERDKLNKSVTELTKQVETLSLEKKKVEDDAKAATEEAKAAKIAKMELDSLRQEMEELRIEKEKEEEEIESLGKLWEEASAVYFHAAIKQMKFLNPGVKLNTWECPHFVRFKMVSGTVLSPLVTWKVFPGTRSQLALWLKMKQVEGNRLLKRKGGPRMMWLMLKMMAPIMMFRLQLEVNEGLGCRFSL
ncbi:ER-Golgi family vesicle-tethering protein [Sesbania bispinosa]|nr:ER-Golgi family vesicle-tethering protein [Sesbania bispinosa]